MKRKDLRFGYLYNVRGQRGPWKYDGIFSDSSRHVKMSDSVGTKLIALTNIVSEYIPTHYTLSVDILFDHEEKEFCLTAYPFLEQRRMLIFDVETARQLRDQLTAVLDSLPAD